MITELNETGLSFVSGREWQVGEEVTIAWRLEPGRPPIQLLCAVRHSQTSSDPLVPKSTGVEFLKVTTSERLQIISFLSAKPKV